MPRAGGDDGEGEVVVGELGSEPVAVAEVVVGDGGGEFGFDGKGAVGVFDDEVDFVAAAFGAQMKHVGFGVLCVDPEGEGDE